MSTTTLDFTHAAAARPASMRISFIERLIAVRARQAELAVRPYLKRLSDQELRDLGYTPSAISALRSTPDMNPIPRL